VIVVHAQLRTVAATFPLSATLRTIQWLRVEEGSRDIKGPDKKGPGQVGAEISAQREDEGDEVTVAMKGVRKPVKQ
jgi:hypothetical protein